MYSSVLMFLVMLFAGPLVYSLPYSVLGAIIIVALRSFFKQALQLPVSLLNEVVDVPLRIYLNIVNVN